jgi:anaerobic selenocysteine-containing dehydrogenase
MVNSTLNETNLFGIDNENLILPFRDEDESESLLGIKTEAKIIADIADRSIEREGLSFDYFNKNNDIMMATQKLFPELLKKNVDDPKDLVSSHETTKATQCKFMIPTQTSWKIESQYNSFNLSSVRSEGQFNTMIYDEADIFRNQKSRDVLYISAEDIKILGLSDGSLVDVKSETGSLKKVRLAKFDIKPGNVMTYMPEANILIPQNNDKRSKTPSFKSVSVTIINH